MNHSTNIRAIIGMVLMFIGCASMDSESLILPSVMTLGGAMILFLEGRTNDQ